MASSLNPFALAELTTHAYSFAAKKIIYQMIGDKLAGQEKTVDAITAAIQGPKDYENFGKLLVTIFESGFFKAVEAQKEKLEKLGFKATVTAGENKQNINQIFRQEKSG